LRDIVFAKVAQRSSYRTRDRRHLHSLSLRFHLERQTGGVSVTLSAAPVADSLWLRDFQHRHLLRSLVGTILIKILISGSRSSLGALLITLL
jgi:hypothetical protein